MPMNPEEKAQYDYWMDKSKQAVYGHEQASCFSAANLVEIKSTLRELLAFGSAAIKLSEKLERTLDRKK